MGRTRRCLVRLTVEPDDQEFSRVDGGAGRKGPARQVRVAVGEEPAVQANGVRAGVVKLHPRVAFTGIIGEAGNVFRFDFIDPKRRERRQSGTNGVRRAGRVERAGWILNRLNVLIAAKAAAG